MQNMRVFLKSTVLHKLSDARPSNIMDRSIVLLQVQVEFQCSRDFNQFVIYYKGFIDQVTSLELNEAVTIMNKLETICNSCYPSSAATDITLLLSPF